MDKIYCTGVTRLPKGWKRSERRNEKAKRLRPALYEFLMTKVSLLTFLLMSAKKSLMNKSLKMLLIDSNGKFNKFIYTKELINRRI